MHVFPLQCRQLPGVNCVDGGSPASSDSHQLNTPTAAQNICAIIINGLDRS